MDKFTRDKCIFESLYNCSLDDKLYYSLPYKPGKGRINNVINASAFYQDSLDKQILDIVTTDPDYQLPHHPNCISRYAS